MVVCTKEMPHQLFHIHIHNKWNEVHYIPLFNNHCFLLTYLSLCFKVETSFTQSFVTSTDSYSKHGPVLSDIFLITQKYPLCKGWLKIFLVCMEGGNKCLLSSVLFLITLASLFSDTVSHKKHNDILSQWHNDGMIYI